MHEFTLTINDYQYDATVEYIYYPRIGGNEIDPPEPAYIDLGECEVLFDGKAEKFHLPKDVANDLQLEILESYQ